MRRYWIYLNAVGLEILSDYESLAADVDGDSLITMYDASQIARHVVGLEVPETAGTTRIVKKMDLIR